MLEMITIPISFSPLIPVLSVWWTHRRAERREYIILAVSLLVVLVPLTIITFHDRDTAFAGTPIGIRTFQIPLAIFVAALITVIPTRLRLLRNFVAVLAGEFIMNMITWIT